MNPDTRLDAPTGPAQAIRPAPDPLADESTALLQGALAEAWPAAPAPASLRERLAQRASHSARRIGAMVNVRQRERVQVERAEGASVYRIYRRDDAAPIRPGEPWQVRVIELRPGATWAVQPGEAHVGRDWLLVRGAAQLHSDAEGPVPLGPLDYHVQGAGPSLEAARLQAGDAGATVMLRERALGEAGSASAESSTARDTPEAWEDYAPLIKRRVLWQEGPMAAMLWLASPGATVPHHQHGHDEECLMLKGDLFQDDYLLREGDYQLAPSGSAHETVNTDTGALIYAHGDLDMRLV